METDNLCLLQEWILAWSDLMEFEVVPVATSKDTRATAQRYNDVASPYASR